MDYIIANCGRKVYKEDGWVCPYYSRPEEWKQHNAHYGPCGVNIQVGTNRCLDVLYEAEDIMYGNIDPDREFDFEDIE